MPSRLAQGVGEDVLGEQLPLLVLVPDFKLDAQNNRGRGRNVAVPGIAALVGQRQAQAVVLPAQAELGVQHLLRLKVAAGGGEQGPVVEKGQRGLAVHFLAGPAQRDRLLGQPHIADLDVGAAVIAVEIDFVAADAAIVGIDVDAMGQAEIGRELDRVAPDDGRRCLPDRPDPTAKIGSGLSRNTSPSSTSIEPEGKKASVRSPTLARGPLSHSAWPGMRSKLKMSVSSSSKSVLSSLGRPAGLPP